MDYRCPKHDLVFEAFTDMRKPGANATATLAAMPRDGHPDCPKCQEDLANIKLTPADVAAAARARAVAAQQVVAEAQAAATTLANEAAAAERAAVSKQVVSNV